MVLAPLWNEVEQAQCPTAAALHTSATLSFSSSSLSLFPDTLLLPRVTKHTFSFVQNALSLLLPAPSLDRIPAHLFSSAQNITSRWSLRSQQNNFLWPPYSNDSGFFSLQEHLVLCSGIYPWIMTLFPGTGAGPSLLPHCTPRTQASAQQRENTQLLCIEWINELDYTGKEIEAQRLN